MNSPVSLLPNDSGLGDRIDRRMAEVESRLRQVVRSSSAFVDKATSYLALAGGKRLRPLLCLLAAELGPRPESERVYDVALTVELTHLASLYHDDVMDEAPLRRGVPTAQRLFGNSAAIMAGDVLFARASALVAQAGPQAVLLHAQAFERLCVGQLNETAGPVPGCDPIDHYLQVLADKTGSLIAVSARHGALAGGASEEIARAVAMYGEKIGVAFQLADDVIDLVSDPQLTGKTPGTDLLENVSTMPTLLLRRQAADGSLDGEGKEILRLLDGGRLREDHNLERAMGLLRAHSVVDETRSLAEKWSAQALEQLEMLPDSEVKQAFSAFAGAMVHRMA